MHAFRPCILRGGLTLAVVGAIVVPLSGSGPAVYAATNIVVETQTLNHPSRQSPITYEYDVKNPNTSDGLTTTDTANPPAPSADAVTLFGGPPPNPPGPFQAIRIPIDGLHVQTQAESSSSFNNAADGYTYDQAYYTSQYYSDTNQTFVHGQTPVAAYGDVVPAVKAVQQLNPNVLIYANLKCGPTGGGSPWASWIQGNSFASNYANFLLNYLVYMKSWSINIGQLGIMCELNPKTFTDNALGTINTSQETDAWFYQRYANVITDLQGDIRDYNSANPSNQLQTPGFVGPDTWSPKVYDSTGTWANFIPGVTGLTGSNANGYPYSGTINAAATHFYNTYRGNAVSSSPTNETGEAELRDFTNSAPSMRLWDSEFHWDLSSGQTSSSYGPGRATLLSLFDNFDDGITGLAWWAYQLCSGTCLTSPTADPRAQIETQFTDSTSGTSALTATGSQGGSSGTVSSGQLIARAYRAFSGGVPVAGSATQVWVINDTANAVTNTLQATANGASDAVVSATCQMWTSSNSQLSASSPAACTVNTNGTVTLPSMPTGSIVQVTFNSAA